VCCLHRRRDEKHPHGITGCIVRHSLTAAGYDKVKLPEGSPVMVKVLRGDILARSTAVVANEHVFRFVHEMVLYMAMMATLPAPRNVVRVLSLMTEPMPAIVMEEFGVSLVALKAELRRAFRAREALCILLDVVDGIRQLASAGMYQWDLNPGNVLVEEHAADGGFTAKLCDFGLAMRREPPSALTSMSLVGYGTKKTLSTPHIYASRVTPSTDLALASICAVGHLMGFIAFPQEPLLARFQAHCPGATAQHERASTDLFDSSSAADMTDLSAADSREAFRGEYLALLRQCTKGQVATPDELRVRLTKLKDLLVAV
jgi:serine/threonine protein kinase